MRERLKQYAAALVVAALFAAPWLIVARVSETPAGPSYTPTGCAEGDRACMEWIDVQKEERWPTHDSQAPTSTSSCR